MPARNDESDVELLRAASAPGARGSGVIAVPRLRFSDALVRVLADLGVEVAFGLMGGSIVPFYDAIARSTLKLVHARHEAGAGFAAIEAHFASGRPALVFGTTGPGLTNAVTAIAAARWEGAKVVFAFGTTSAPQRGRWAFQETSAFTMGGFFAQGPLFHYAASIDDAEELDGVATRLAAGLSRPGGFVAGIGLPVGLQAATVRAPRGAGAVLAPAGCSAETARQCASLLADGPFVLWVGFGAREAWREVRRVAERTGARVICTPRGKGIFPEDHPLFLGVTGLGGDPHVAEWMSRHRPRRMLVLGTRLGEFSSFWDPALVPRDGFVHVDLDPDVPGASYPNAITHAVHADVGAFLRAIERELGAWPEPEAAPESLAPLNAAETPVCARASAPVRTSALFEAVQRVVVEQSDAIVLADAGNAFAWSTRVLRFRDPGRYRVSVGFGSMGHAVTGVVGAALGRGGKAVAIVGDGAMLMLSEVSTAVQHGVSAVWIVLNDARYGMTTQGMGALGFTPAGMEIPRTDFVMLARALGAEGIRVERETDLDDALAAAMQAEGPVVVDVLVDPDERSPMGNRVKQLAGQWSGAGRARP
jgi:acetolactate synthase-1/2/3 large subunit